MVEFQSDDSNLSRRGHPLSKSDDSMENNSESDIMKDKVNEDVSVKGKEDERESAHETTNPGLLTRLSGRVLNTASSAVGTAYGGVSWVAGGVWSTTGTAIGTTYNTVSALSPVNLFRKESKSKSD